MAKRKAPRGRQQVADGETTPRLGMVIRFRPGSGAAGIQQMETGGFRVASSRDFRAAAAVPNDFDGADVQYFERFGLAIVRREGERLARMLKESMEHKVVSGARAERSYRKLGRAASLTNPIGGVEEASIRGAKIELEYLRGYRAGVTQLIDRLLAGDLSEGAQATARFDEASVTWGLQAVKVPLSARTGAGIKVAVLDTGFDDKHPDFRGRSVTKKLFASRSSQSDVDGHGTHCIGTACGPLRPASAPRYGVAHEAEIYAGKVLGDDGYGTDRSIIAGMDWAVEQGCEIISMSLGAITEIGDQPNEDYEQIGQICLDSGTLVIAAAGNESDRPQLIKPVGSPANASTIMAVGAVDRSYQLAAFSCGGLNPGQEVDLVAPGVDILSCVPGGGYARWDGTSMATPHVAGVAALIAESDKKFRGWTLWARLLQLVSPLSHPPRDIGKGLLQAPQS